MFIERRQGLGFALQEPSGGSATGDGTVDISMCDPFWTLMNEGYCSDSNGQYLRRNGQIARVDGVSGNRRWIAGVSNEMVLAGVALFGILMTGAALQR
jgi:hypothetical protein